MELFDYTALELGAKIQAGEISAVEAARACLERIEKLEPVVHAFVTVTPEAAIARAEEVQKKIASGELKHPLAGVPMAVKDLISTKGVRTTCSSKMLENYVPVFDATVVQKLDAIGAVVLRRDGHQADVWRGLPLWAAGVCVVAGSDWSADHRRAGCRRRDCRADGQRRNGRDER